MDPNVARQTIKDSATELYEQSENGWVINVDLTKTCVESFLALDEWLLKGGFKPSAWEAPALPGHWQTVLSSTNANSYAQGFEDAQQLRKLEHTDAIKLNKYQQGYIQALENVLEELEDSLTSDVISEIRHWIDDVGSP